MKRLNQPLIQPVHPCFATLGIARKKFIVTINEMRTNYPYFFLGLIGLIILGCREKVPDFERTVFNFNNQNIEILTTFNLIDNYLSKSKYWSKQYY